MKLSKLKLVLPSIMIIGILSLNVINPFSVSNNQFDPKGIADEIPLSTTTSTLAEEGSFIAAVLLVTRVITPQLIGEQIVTNLDVCNGIARLDRGNFELSKLD